MVFPRLDDSFYISQRRLLFTQRLEPSVLYVAPQDADCEFIEDNVARSGIDLYLCSIYTRGWNEFCRFSQSVGRERIIAGGYHPTAQPLETIPYAHKVVSGYCGNVDEIIAESKNGVFTGSLSFTPMRRDLIDQVTLCQVYPDIMPWFRVGSMVSSVGCPYDCSFCSTPQMSQRKMRVSGLEYVEAEIADLKARGVNSVFIRDESFATNPALREVASLFRGKFDMVYSFGTGNVMGSREDLVAHLAENGWHSLNFGLEDVGESYRKNKLLKQATERCREHGIGVVLSFIVNDDGKTQEEARANYRALFDAFCDLLPFQVCANFLMPFPGTGIWSTYKDRISVSDFEKFDSKTPLFVDEGLRVWHQRMIIAIQLKYYYSSLYRKRVRVFECGDILHHRVTELQRDFGFEDGGWDTFLGF